MEKSDKVRIMSHFHSLLSYTVMYEMRIKPFEEICSKPFSTGRDKDYKEIVTAIDSGG